MFSREKNIIELTPENYRNKNIIPLNNKEGYFVLYYADWCGHCRDTKPSWIKLANKISPEFNVCVLDCVKYTKFSNKLGIKGFPTIKVYDHTGKYLENFNNSRDIKGYLSGICKNIKASFC